MLDLGRNLLVLVVLGLGSAFVFHGQSTTAQVDTPVTSSGAGTTDTRVCEARAGGASFESGSHAIDLCPLTDGIPAGTVLRVRAIVALVPDPIRSKQGIGFDARVATLRAAAVEAGYQPDRFDFPWLQDFECEQEKRCDSGNRSANATTGSMLFRRWDSGKLDVAVMLLVRENPTFGVDPHEFQVALSQADSIIHSYAPDGSRQPVLEILGPSYSGAIDSLRRVLPMDLPSVGSIRFRTVASDHGRLKALVSRAEGRPPVDVTAYSLDGPSTLKDVRGLLESRTSCPRTRIALLYESDSGYGSSVSAVAESGKLIRVPFPLHLSQLWAEKLKNGKGEQRALHDYDPRVAHALELFPEKVPAALDVPPAVFPGTNANVTDRLLADSLQRVADYRPDFVGIQATEVGDVIFLAGLLRRYVPGAQLFSIGSDVLLTHPRHTRDLLGMWVFAPPSAPSWRDPFSGQKRLFASNWEESMYFAALAAMPELDGSERSPADLEKDCITEETSRPGSFAATACGDGFPSAIEWSVVGNSRMWPVAVFPLAARKVRNWGRDAGSHALWIAVVGTLLWLAVLVEEFGVTLAEPGPTRDADHWLASTSMRHQMYLALILVSTVAGSLLGVVMFGGSRPDASRDWLSSIVALGPVACGTLVVVMCSASCAFRIAIPRKGGLRDGGLQSALLHPAILASVFGSLLLGYLMIWILICRGEPAPARIVHILNGVSPLPPWCFLVVSLASAACGWAAHCSKQAWIDRVFGATKGGLRLSRLAEVLSLGLQSPFLKSPEMRTIALGASVSFAALALLLREGEGGFRFGIQTMETREFSFTVTLLFAAATGASASAAAGAVGLWRRTQVLLRCVRRGPLQAGFAIDEAWGVRRTLGLRIGTGTPRICDVEVEERLLSEARRRLLALPFAVPVRSGSLDLQSDRDRAIAEFPEYGSLVSHAALVVKAKIDAESANLPVDRACRAAGASVTVVRLSVVVLTRYLAVVFAQMRALLGSAITCALLVLLAAGSYPMQPQYLLLRIAGALVLAVVGVAVVLIVTSERNEVLSKLTGRSPGAVDLDATFLAQIVTYVLVPVMILMATLFPALSEVAGGVLSALRTR